MNKLTIKTSNFAAGKKVFVNQSGGHIVSESETLPEGYLLGAELPEEEGVYFLLSSKGSFVINMYAGVPSIYPYNYWASRTGSGIDGGYMYANTDFSGATAETGTLDTSTDSLLAPASFGEYFDSLIDWGDFYTLSPLFVNGAAASGGGFLKYDKTSGAITEVFHETATYIDFYYAASVDLGGFIFIENDFTLVHVDAYTGTVTSYDSSPQTTPLARIDYLIDLGNGYFAATRSGTNGNAYVYRFNEGVFSYIGERTWYIGALNTSGVNFAWDHLFQIHRDIEGNALYLYDNASGWRVRKIDLTTFEIEWQFDLPLNLPYEDVFLIPMGNWIDTYLDTFTGELLVSIAYRETAPTGTTYPGVIRLDKDTGAISSLIRAPAGRTNSNYYIRKVSEDSLIIFHSSAEVLVQDKVTGDLTNSFIVPGVGMEFAFYERYPQDLNGFIYALDTDSPPRIHRVNEEGSTLLDIPSPLMNNINQVCYPILADGKMIIAAYGTTVSLNIVEFS